MNSQLVLDTHSEVYELLLPWCHSKFWDFATHEIVPGAIYLIGRQQMILNATRIKQIAEQGVAKIIFSNPAEGSETLAAHCERYGISQLIQSGRMLLIGGGDMDPVWPHLQYDCFLPKILDYDENVTETARIQEIFIKKQKPYKFLFLNGRTRVHRKYLRERFELNGLLNLCLWSYLDLQTAHNANISLCHNGQNLMAAEHSVKYLDSYYEVDAYRHRINIDTTDRFVKNHLFNREWGDVYINAEPYIDTYFSLVTETVFEYPYSFRTEKIWKPVAMGHPFIAVANRGYYRDLHALGFQTFGHVIDESFDLIDNNQSRLERLVQVVEDLCRQDLDNFLKECYTVCKYNQQHLDTMRVQVRQKFPKRFFQFLKQYE